MQSKPTPTACDRLHGVLAMCMEISNNTKADCFFDYSPHVNSYSVNIHRDGWVSGADAEYIDMVTDITEDNIMATLNKLAAIYCELEGMKNV